MSGEWTLVTQAPLDMGDCALCGCLIEQGEAAYVCRVPAVGEPVTASAHASHFGLLVDHYLRDRESASRS